MYRDNTLVGSLFDSLYAAEAISLLSRSPLTRGSVVELAGIEPATPCLQRGFSRLWASIGVRRWPVDQAKLFALARWWV